MDSVMLGIVIALALVLSVGIIPIVLQIVSDER